MKISTMLNREDFYLINQRTLQGFFSNLNKNDCKVVTNSSIKGADLYVFKHLNAIFTRKASSEVKKYIETEYRIKGNPIKRLIIRLYISVCFALPELFADKSIIIENNHIDLKSILVYPCNRKIRIFNFEKNIVEVVVKSGFTNEALLNEIMFRTEFNEEFILPILRYNDNQYTEAIINGIPLARITNSKRYEKSKMKVIDCLKILLEKTKKDKNLNEYLDSLQKEIYEKIIKFDTAGEKIYRENLFPIITHLTHNCSGYKGTIPIVLSHGDLQHGNIWVENETDRIFIIDWESAAYRSIWYDLFMLFSGARCKENILQLHTNPSKDYFALFESLYEPIDYHCIASIVILEDIAYKIGEALQLPNNLGLSDLQEYLSLVLKTIEK